ncbi:hypothetical protein PHAVU_011G083300 [Phaseolus vulgaris]|uniref:Thionin-like protein n=1 Tax=Phaseolus vulgaris TaxID=3885 RepID=V7AGA3_PHAVU|nr:hypothetical protein PHAVU_011G083300g [Phaseolus vulgaris]ESW04295.1 hypothetical protein PHAVU_011G083300g [Phaseolus vulgaris]
MLGFVQILKIEAEIPCPILCAIGCFSSNVYPQCFATCITKCPDISSSAYNCVRSCGTNKSITVNIDARGNVTNVVDSCLQKCPH